MAPADLRPHPLLLAVQHDRYALLLRVLQAWKRRAQRHRERRKRVAAACRVGAAFYQRIFWEKWRAFVARKQQQRHQLAQLEALEQEHKERRLRRVWQVWSAWTREKEQREQQRRRAVRAHYLSLLHKGFDGFRAWRTQQKFTLNQVETLLDAAEARILSSAFSRWKHFASERKLRTLMYERAVLHYESRLLRHVWSKGFYLFYSTALRKKKMMLAAQEQHYHQTISQSFCHWKDAWRADCDQNEALDKIRQGFMAKKERTITARVLENWIEFTRAKAARRVVNAQIRGQVQRRTVQKHLSQWVSYVSQVRWQQITCARADQHYKSVMWRKCFKRWRDKVIHRQRYRRTIRAALVHWKMTLERRIFDRWKHYLHVKRMKQLRIHEALEFRHEQFVRDGLRHWMTAALHLQEQRDQHVTHTQASNTTNVWRRVGAIARHWRYLAIRRRAMRGRMQVLERQSDEPRRVLEDLGRQSEPVINFKYTDTTSDDGKDSIWTKQRSPLSEFVLLPRNRPQPRRPVEVLLFSKAELEKGPLPNEHLGTFETLRCGFDFPVEPFPPLSPPRNTKLKPPGSTWKLPPSSTTSVNELRKRPELSTTAAVEPPREGGDLLLPNTTARQLDVLERKLLALSQRKREWKASQEQLEGLREDAGTNPRLLSKLRVMEEQHAAHTKQWLHMKGCIRSLATEIQQLRGAL